MPAGNATTITWGSSNTWSMSFYLPVDGDDFVFFAFFDSDGDGDHYNDVRGRYDNGNYVTLKEANNPYTGIDIELDQ
jgi:hypothetical protein